MTDKIVLKLLIVHSDSDEANRYLSLIRNAGYEVKAKQVDSREDLPELLQNSSWNLFLAEAENESPSPKEVFHQIRRLNKDVPVILISKNVKSDILSGLRLGASDVIDSEDDQHLLLAIANSLFNLEQRRNLRYWKRRYLEAEKRCEGLLQNSKDAIAIVQEGMYTYTNDSFSQLFGYLADDMECLPVMDTVAPESFTKVKPLLKMLFTDDAWEAQTINFKGLRGDNLPIDIQLNTFQVEFNDEPALQFLIKNNDLKLEVDSSKQAEQSDHSLTEINLTNLIKHIDFAITQAICSHQDSLLLHIHINHFNHVREENGLQVSEELFSQVANLLTEKKTFKQTIGRFNEDSLLILLETADAKTGIQLCEDLCSQIEERIFEVGQNTFSLSLSIGMCVVSETLSTAEGAIKRCLAATAKLTSTENTSGERIKLHEVEYSPHAPTVGEDVEEAGRGLLQNDLFELLYQPVLSLHGHNEHFYEVLIHIKQKANPKIFAANFISQVFKTDAAEEIDHWVIKVALNKLKHKLTTDSDTKLFINLSLATLKSPDLIPWLSQALKDSGVPHDAIVFQLRETDVNHQLNQAIKITQQLQKLGSKVALAHFGLAIEPMSLLQRLSVDFIKLDRQLVNKAHEDDSSLHEMEAFLERLHSQNQQLIVPFIEKASMMPTLWKAGVHYVQGHYLQIPKPDMSYDFSSE